MPAILTGQQHSEWMAWKTDTALPLLRRSTYLLGGRVRTPCGGFFHGRTAGKQIPVYACKRRLRTKADDPERCGCLSIRVETLDDAVWSQIRAALTSPTPTAALGSVPGQAGRPDDPAGLDIGGDTLALRIADAAHHVGRLQETIAGEYQAARGEGFDPATARMMLRPLQTELTQAHDKLSRLTRVRAALTRSADDPTADRQTLNNARARVDELDVPGKHDVLEALAVRAQVTGYRVCTTCDGTRYRPIPPGSGRHWPPSCPSCHRLRVLPDVTVEITSPEALLALTTPAHRSAAAAGRHASASDRRTARRRARRTRWPTQRGAPIADMRG